MTRSADVRIQIDPRWRPRAEPDLLERAVRIALEVERVTGEVALSLVLLDDGEIAAYHHDFRGEPGPTDVLSFPYDGPPDPEETARYLGDVLIGIEQATRQASERGHALADELQLLAIHGTLHLLGHDDEAPEARGRMWARQREALRAIGLERIAPGGED